MEAITLIHGVGQATVNVSSFMAHLMASLFAKQDEPLADILSSTQSWYAYEHETSGAADEDGFSFGPSKFVGYRDMNAKTYLANNGVGGQLNGRDTEKVLTRMSTLLTPDDSRYEPAFNALADLCAKFGKTPNARARISMLNLTQEERVVTEAEQITALATLISTLSDEGRKQLKRLAFQ